MAIDERRLFEAAQLDMSPEFRRRLERDLLEAASRHIEDEKDSHAPALLVAHPTTRRRTWLTMSAAALVVAVTVGVAAIRVHQRQSPKLVPSPPTALTSTSAPPDTQAPVPTTITAAPSSAIDWTAVDLDNDLVAGAAYQQVTGDGPLFAWTSDVRASPEVASELYRSEDGVDWTQVPMPAGFSIVAANATSEQVALLGFTLPDDAIAAAEMVAMLSDDAGTTWRTIPFTVELPPRAAPAATLVRASSALIAISGNAVVASFATNDVWGSPPDVVVDANGNTMPTGRPLYVSVDSEPFRPIGGEPSALPGPSIALSATGGRFLLLATPPSIANSEPGVLWQSQDGQTWAALGSVPKAVPGATLGKVGDRYVVVPLCCEQAAWISEDGADWNVSDFGGVLINAQPGSFHSALAVVGADGITIAGMYSDTSPSDADYTKDGVTERLVGGSISNIVFFDDATGTELGRVTTTPFDNGSVRALGDGKIDILDVDGNVRTSFTADELTDVMNAAMLNQPPPVAALLHSDNGDAWTSAPIDQIAGGRSTDVGWIQRIGDAMSVGAFVSTGPEAVQTHLVVMVGRRRS